MRIYKIILFLVLLGLCSESALCNEYDVATFRQFIDADVHSGDTLNITSDLTSDETIGNHFYGLDITFEGNNHYINGSDTFGGFVLSQDSHFNNVGVRNCKGQNYEGSNFAGAIYNSGGHTYINNSAFTDNFVDTGGFNFGVAGAVYNLNGGTIDIDTALFENNYTNGASSFGGAVANGYLAGNTAYMTVNNAIFRNNYSYGSVNPYGGALYNNGDIKINNTLFENNYAEGERGSFIYGGALYNSGDMSIDNSTIKGNYSIGQNSAYAFGGAIYNNANLTINNSSISDNNISDVVYGDGGAIYNGANGDLKITNSVLENNKVIQT